MRLHNITALLSVLVLGASVLTGCGSNGPSIKEEELPYGATMREDKSGNSLPITYDRRFMNEEQAAVLTDYLYAVQTCDGDLYKKNTLDFYADYQLNEIYAGKYEDLDAMMTALHASVAEATAEDFTYVMITVDNFTQERSVSGLGTMLEVLTKISGDENFTDTVTDCWAVEMQWLLVYDGGASSVVVNEQYVYMFEIGGKYYCMM